MALHAGPMNNTKPGNVGALVYNFIAALIATGQYAWKASGDGLSAYSSSGSVFTAGSGATQGSGTGANGWDNSGAWGRIAYTGALSYLSGREYLFIRGSAGGDRLAGGVSLSAKFTGGSPSATVPPTATDQQIWVGSALAAANSAQVLSSAVASQTYSNAFADDTSGFAYMFGFTQGPTAICGGVCWEVVQNLSSGSGGTDPDPMIYAGAGGSTGLFGNTNPNFSGFSNGSWIKGNYGIILQGPYLSSYNGTNPYYSNKDDLIPSLVSSIHSATASSTYFKGLTTNWLTDIQTYSKSSPPIVSADGTRVYISSGTTMPWDGSTLIVA